MSNKLTLMDLDFENSEANERADAVREIAETRAMLGKFTLRDSMEAVYGTKYTVSVLGESGGNDILVEELSANDDIREARGEDRRDIGRNRMPSRTSAEMTSTDRTAAATALREQEAVVEKALDDSLAAAGGNLVRGAAQKVLADIIRMSDEERLEIIKLLQQRK